MSMPTLTGFTPSFLRRAPEDPSLSFSQPSAISTSASNSAEAALRQSLFDLAERDIFRPLGNAVAPAARTSVAYPWTATPQTVVQKIRKQQAFISSTDVEDIIVSNFPVEDHRLASLMLDEMTRFASMKSLNKLQGRLVKDSNKKKLDIHYDREGSLGSTLHYLTKKHKSLKRDAIKDEDSKKDKFFNHGKLINNDELSDDAEPLPSPFIYNVLIKKPLNKVKQGAVLLDAITLHQLSQSEPLRDHVLKHKLQLLYPQGWDEGVNPFNQLTIEGIAVKLSKLVNIAKRLQQEQGLSEEQSVEKAMSHPTRSLLASWGLDKQLKILNPDSSSETSLERAMNQHSAFPSSGKVAKKLAPASISEEDLEGVLEKFPGPVYRQGALEVLAQQAEIFSPLRLSLSAQALHLKILNHAKKHNIPPHRIFYHIPAPGKSLGLVSANHLMANEVPWSQLIEHPASIKQPEKSLLVILDDIAGSGFSLLTVKDLIRQDGFSGKIIIVPIISSTKAKKLFEQKADSNTVYLTEHLVPSFKKHPSFQAQSPVLKQLMQRVVGTLGFNENGLSVALPYMSPDNNNAFFSKLIAPYFTLNRAGCKGWIYNYPTGTLNETRSTDFDSDSQDSELDESDLEMDFSQSPVVPNALKGLKKSPAMMNLAAQDPEEFLDERDPDSAPCGKRVQV